MNTTSIENLTALSESAEAHPDLKRWLLLSVKFLVSASLLFFILSRADINKIWTAMSSANLGLVNISFLLHGI